MTAHLQLLSVLYIKTRTRIAERSRLYRHTHTQRSSAYELLALVSTAIGSGLRPQAAGVQRKILQN